MAVGVASGGRLVREIADGIMIVDVAEMESGNALVEPFPVTM